MKNKYKGVCVLSTQPDQQKGPNAKMRQKIQKKLSNIEEFYLARFAHLAFYTIRISGAANRHAPVQHAKNVLFCFFLLFFLSCHYDTNPLLHLYYFRQKYNYLLANIKSESSRVIFTFFVFIKWVKHFCTPATFVTI